MSLYRALRSLITDRKGVTALEYALIASLIAVAVITGAQTVGTRASGTFTNISTNLR